MAVHFWLSKGVLLAFVVLAVCVSAHPTAQHDILENKFWLVLKNHHSLLLCFAQPGGATDVTVMCLTQGSITPGNKTPTINLFTARL